MELCADVVRKGRGQTGSAYVRFTIYDLRFGNLARQRRGNFAKQERAECDEAVRSGGGICQDGGAWRSLCTMFDVRGGGHPFRDIWDSSLQSFLTLRKYSSIPKKGVAGCCEESLSMIS